MSAVAAAMRLASARLKRPALWTALGLATLFVAAFSFIERNSNPVNATDTALTSGVFGVAIPLLGFLFADAVTQGQRLEASVFVLARYGANRRLCILGLLVTSAAALIVTSVGLSVLCIAVTRKVTDPLFYNDIAVTSWVATIGAVAYSTWFACASSFGRTGRAWALGIDFILGSGASLAAAAWPRGHLRNLAGGSPVWDLSQREALLTLVGLSAVYLLIAELKSAN